ncbi:hypothetical protein, partial [Methanocaldococcus sp.]
AVFYAWGSGLFNGTQETTSKEIGGVTNTMATDSAGKMMSVDIPDIVNTKGFADLDKDNILDGPYNYSGYLRDDKFIQEIPITITYNGVTPLTNVKVVAGDYEVTAGGYDNNGYEASEIYWLHLKKLDDGSYQLMFKDDTEYKGNMTAKKNGWIWDGLPFGPDGTDKSSYIYKFEPKRNDYNLRLYDFAGRCYTLFEVNATNTSQQTDLFNWHSYNNATDANGIPLDKSFAVAEAFNSYKMLDDYFSSPEYVVGDLKQGDQKTISMYMYFQYLGLYDKDGNTVNQATIKVPITIKSDVGVLKTTEITVNVPKFE